MAIMGKTSLQKPTAKAWYHQGLKFTCTACGNCCTGASGYVWVNKAEIAAIAQYLGMSVANLETKHVRKVGIRKSLVELPKSNWDCTFFDPKTRQCTIYSVRPRQCRTWPFWRSNIHSQTAWESTCEICPGSGNGKHYSLKQIEHMHEVFRV